MTTTLDKTYSPQSMEADWYANWEKMGYFQPSKEGEPYCIVLPPPNVTGSLHMGHGFGFTLVDVLIRHARMMGKKTLWQGGTDHAGIATQMVVERRLNQEGKTRHDLGRDAFVEKIWEWKEESGGNITRQLRRLGASIEWSREKFTLDETLSTAVREVFIKLHEEGLIYRGERLVNWDPVLLTAISDLEVISEEEQGHLWHIKYALEDNSGFLVVATTRPETLLGDTAVAVHPDDERYKHLIGKHVQLPLCNRLIPIIADDSVDPAFGTGCVKITPAHDFNDYAMGQRHQLTPINIFTPTAHINDNAPEAYRGLDRFKARKQIISDLEKLNLLDKIEKHTLKIPRGERSGVVVEPYLTKQWFMKMAPLAKPAIRAVESGDIQFVPENWSKTYFQWMNNIEDWCISRQLWWGHRIPVWYDKDGNAYSGQNEADVRERHKLAEDIELKQDDDVLDTWFSSALWPFSSLGWPEKTPDFKDFFPTNTLITGFDIIFFWVARMIMMSLKFTGKVPFRKVYITGLIRDHEGHKMSKSKGNVLDPIDLIDGIGLEDLVKKRTYGLMKPEDAEKITKNTRKEFPEGIAAYGTDALRFTYCANASYTREIRFDVNRLAGYRNFCNKLWNAARFVLMNTENQEIAQKGELSYADIWIQSRLNKALEEADSALKEYRFDLFAQALYDFTWNEFCDWYLEFSKAKQTPASRYQLVSTLEALLRALHPIMPFITEEIWQQIAPLVGKDGKTIMLEPYPRFNDTPVTSARAVDEIEFIKKIITSIRTIKSEMNIAPGKQVTLLLRKGNAADKHIITNQTHLLNTLAKVISIQWLEDNENPPQSASAFIGELEIYIPLEGLIDLKEETARLEREKAKLDKELIAIQNKLNNANFVDRAPADVVAKEKARLDEIKLLLEKITKSIPA